MIQYRIDARDDKKNIFSGHIRQGGSNPSGEHLSFTNYYMERNGKPFFAYAVKSTFLDIMSLYGKMKLLK